MGLYNIMNKCIDFLYEHSFEKAITFYSKKANQLECYIIECSEGAVTESRDGGGALGAVVQTDKHPSCPAVSCVEIPWQLSESCLLFHSLAVHILDLRAQVELNCDDFNIQSCID